MNGPRDDHDHDHDHDLEHRLRSVLHERAATITGRGLGLPDIEATATALPTHRRGRAFAAAAIAATVLLGGLALATRDRGDRGPARVLTTQPTTSTTAPAGDGSIFNVPDVWDPGAAAREFLRVWLGDGTDATDAAVHDLPLQVGAAEDRGSGTVIVPVTWKGPGAADSDPTSTVWVSVGVRGSTVVGATTEGFDLSGVHQADQVLAGQISPPADLRDDASSVATVIRLGGMPLFEPDVAVQAGENEPMATTVPVGERFELAIGTNGTLVVTVRTVDDSTGEVVGIAAVPVDAPTDPAFENLSPDEAEAMAREALAREALEGVPSASESPACQEVGPFPMPEPGSFPTELPAHPSPPSSEVISARTAPDATAAMAIERLADALGVTWEVGELWLGSTTSAFAIARLPGGRLVDLDLFRTPGHAWRVVQVRTRGACRDFSGSNATPLGSADPVKTVGLPMVPGATDGEVWFRTDAGTERVAVASTDLAARWLNIGADQPAIDGMATVLRDASGDAVLVDVADDGIPPA